MESCLKVKRKQLNIGSFCLFLYLLLYFVLSFIPAVKYSVPYAAAGLFCLLPLAIAALRDKQLALVLIYMLILSFLHGTLKYVLGNAPVSEMINEPIRSFRYFTPCILLRSLMKQGKKHQWFIWGSMSIILLFVAIRTSVAISENPMIARSLANGSASEELTRYRMMNIGGFEFCYAIALTVGAWFFLSRHGNGIFRIAGLAALVLVFLFSASTQYAILFILCVVLCFLTSLAETKGPRKWIVIFFLFAVFFFLPWFLRALAQLSRESTVLYSKFVGLADALEGKSGFDELTSRFRLYWNASLDFFRSPLYGTAESSASASSHSTLLGIAASSGAIGLVAYGYAVCQCYRYTRAGFAGTDQGRKTFAATFWGFMLLSLVNPIHYAYEIGIVVFFYVPLSLQVFKDICSGKRAEPAEKPRAE